MFHFCFPNHFKSQYCKQKKWLSFYKVCLFSLIFIGPVQFVHGQSGCKYNGNYNQILSEVESRNTREDRHKLERAHLESIARYWVADCKCKEGVSTMAEAKKIYQEAFHNKGHHTDHFLDKGVSVKKDMTPFGDLAPPFVVFTPSSCLKGGPQAGGSSLQSGMDCAPEAARVKDLGGQLNAYAGQFFVAYCQCKSGVPSQEYAKKLINTMKINYQSFNDFRNAATSPLSTRPLTKCKIKKGKSSSTYMSHQDEAFAEFQRSLATQQRIHGRLNHARSRAKRVSEELKQLNKLSADASPHQLMQQYNQNMQRINELERELKQDIINSNFSTGAEIINDYNTGNHEGAVYGTLGLLGQMHENNQAKKELAAQKQELQKKKEQRILSAALQMIKELREKRDMYIGYAANSFNKEREKYFVQLAKYYEDYSNHVNQGFSYNHTRWASYSKQPPQKANLPADKNNPTASEYSRAAERKYNLYRDTKKQEYANAAVRYMNAAINKNPRSSNYYLKLSKYYENVNKGAALDAYVAALELNPSKKDEATYKRLSNDFVIEIHTNYIMFIPQWGNENTLKYGGITQEQYQKNYEGPKQYLQDLISDPTFTDPLVLYTSLYGGVVFQSPLEALLYIDAKNGQNHWPHIGAAPRYESKNVHKMTRTLQLCAKDNAHVISTLINLGADPELKIDGKNSIEIAIENGSLDFYKNTIGLADNPERYADQYNKSAIPVIDKYIDNSFDPNYISDISNPEQEEKVALWLLENYGTLSIINSTANTLKINKAKEEGKKPELEGKGGDLKFLKVVNNRSSEAVNKRYEQLLTQILFTRSANSKEDVSDYELSTWIKSAGLPTGNYLYPPEEYSTELSVESKELTTTLDSIGCVLCMDKKSFEEVVETVISYLGSNKAEAHERIARGQFQEAYASYKKTRKFATSFAPKRNLLIYYYNLAAAKNNFPKIDMLEGKVLRPVDQKNETYAHLALLYNRYYSFKAMNEWLPLAKIKNKRGKTVLDYLQVMIVENPREYAKYALLPGIKDSIEWQKQYNGKTVFDVLVEEEAYDILADLAARGVINEDLTPYAFQMAKYGKFKEIAEISRLGKLNLNTTTTEGYGGNLLHAVVRQAVFVDNHYYKNDGWYQENYIKLPTVESIREKYNLDAFLNLDKDLKREDGLTPYKTFRFYAKQYDDYDKDEFKKWKRLLKG